jgi:peroxiredoxin
LRQELLSGGKKDKNHSAKKIALKKIVANMTMSNNDMVALFPDIVTCMSIQSLEIKKMYEISKHILEANTTQVFFVSRQLCQNKARCCAQSFTYTVRGKYRSPPARLGLMQVGP